MTTSWKTYKNREEIGDESFAHPLIPTMSAYSSFQEACWGSGYKISRDRALRNSPHVATYHHSRTCLVPGSYPTPKDIVDRVEESEDYYRNQHNDLYLADFVWATSMQADRHNGLRTARFPDRDHVLESMINRGTQDRVHLDQPNVTEERSMRYSASMVGRLLTRIEVLETEVRVREVGIILQLTRS